MFSVLAHLERVGIGKRTRIVRQQDELRVQQFQCRKVYFGLRLIYIAVNVFQLVHRQQLSGQRTPGGYGIRT